MPKKRKQAEDLQLSFLSAEPGAYEWPNHERLPYNFNGKTVREVVFPDLLCSRAPLIVTGYMSLDMVIEYLNESARQKNGSQDIRIILGHEPTPSVRTEYSMRGHKFDAEIAEYWLEQGISLYQSAKVLTAIRIVEEGRVKVRISNEKADPIHAKIFKGDFAVTMGSSNLSYAGMLHQIEGNSRYTAQDGTWFRDTSVLAERIWELGVDYTNSFLQLLKSLLHAVTWQEALGRACGEVLEGSWAARYTSATTELGDVPPLWPSQQQGIAQAMWVLENVGSVLVADATGSGKTRMGAHLISATMHRIWSSGRMRQDVPMIICPGSVQENWHRATLETGRSVQVFSDGSLSNSSAASFETLSQALRRAQVLAIDESHRFSHRASQRTQRIFNNMADKVLLFTATPINRNVQDLIAMIDLLGADNFDEQVLEIMNSVLSRQAKQIDAPMSEVERRTLQRAIQQFTVRRTKAALNAMIDEAPDLYRNAEGKLCRFPEHRARLYHCGETERDEELARQIREAAGQLLGLSNLRKLYMPDFMRWERVREDNAAPETRYVRRRLAGAQGLALYRVMSALRSGRTALIEHVVGTNEARLRYGITRAKSPTGNILQMLRDNAGVVPGTNVASELPDWLTDSDRHRQATMNEIAIYERIARLAEQVSDAREHHKAEHLIGLLTAHNQVVAFDSHPITLLDLQKRIDTIAVPGCKTVVATGEDISGRKQVTELTRLGSSSKGVIALCSDSMSEGYNLQAASAVVHLDMPTVVRQAEQRVDRMDSPNAVIEAWWPQDSAAFALRTDERFYARVQLVENLIGSNLPLPGDHTGSIVPVEQIIQEYQADEATDASWEGFGDAFA